ncbi:hypothetical protein ACHAWO_002033 [Cyclotella atomus]|uniref:Uncharacterized protein n=1 Tax=Cyclotella atomus TaxID=382360 RepID=A0ABD3PQK3_9STRA
MCADRFHGRKPLLLKRWRACMFQISYVLVIAILLVSAESIMYSYQDRSTCRCDDASIASVLWGYCLECICIGAHCYYTSLQGDGFRKPKSSGINFMNVKSIPRGGETSAAEDELNSGVHVEIQKDNGRTESSKRKDLSLQPLIDTETVSLALRLTCETNRRLNHGTSSSLASRSTFSKSSAETNLASQYIPNSQPPSQDLQLMHHPSVNVQMSHQQTSIRHPIENAIKQIQVVTDFERAEEKRKEELSIFHAKEFWKNELDEERKGVLRWGPNLNVYIDTLLSVIGLEDQSYGKNDASTSTVSTHAKRKQPTTPLEDERQLILSLTVMYLDRATSLDNRQIDPNTGQPWHPSCPYVLPQTVHRLVLTAILMAAKTIRGDVDIIPNRLREAANSLLQISDPEKSQISPEDLQQMENWMMNAIGGGMHHNPYNYDTHWQIPPNEIGKFIRKWGETFYPKRVAAHDERNRSRMERLERFWRDQTSSVFGGYGQQYNMNGGYGGDHGHGNHHVVGWDGQQHQQYDQQPSYYEPMQHDYNAHYHRVGYETFQP